MSNTNIQKPHIRKGMWLPQHKSLYVCELRFYRTGYGSTPLKAWKSFLFNNKAYYRSIVLKLEVRAQEKS